MKRRRFTSFAALAALALAMLGTVTAHAGATAPPDPTSVPTVSPFDTGQPVAYDTGQPFAYDTGQSATVQSVQYQHFAQSASIPTDQTTTASYATEATASPGQHTSTAQPPGQSTAMAPHDIAGTTATSVGTGQTFAPDVG